MCIRDRQYSEEQLGIQLGPVLARLLCAGFKNRMWSARGAASVAQTGRASDL